MKLNLLKNIAAALSQAAARRECRAEQTPVGLSASGSEARLSSEQSSDPQAPSEHERQLALERRVQELRLELVEREGTIARLRTELDQLATKEDERVRLAVRAELEQLLAAVAPAAVQILAQADLIENQGVPVPAQEVLINAKRFVRALEGAGLEFDSRAGERTKFDPNCHEPLSGESAVQPGDAVFVRFVGVRYRGKILRKARVEARIEK